MSRVSISSQYGLNENPQPDIGECTAGFNYDIAVDQTWFQPRSSFDLKGAAPNAGAVTGIMQLLKRDNTQTTLVCAGNTVYLWDGGSTWTSKGTVPSGSYLRDTYWSLGDYLVITDVSLMNVVQKWDGTTLSNLTTGLGTSLYAKYGIVHLGRVWLFNVTTNTPTPHLMVASALEDPTTYDTSKRGGAATGGGASFSTGTEAFYMLTPDLKPINGVALFQNTLIISTLNGRLFQLTGTSAKDFAWVDFFDGSPAVGSESLASIGNDVVFMRQGGHINLLSATQSFGNARTDELTRWLHNTISNLSGANQIIYDITNQKVLFFIPGKVLVLFKDFLAKDRYQLRDSKSPWSVYTTQHPNAFNTNAAKYMLIPGGSSYSVYWGDSSGNVFDLNGSSPGDGSSSYTVNYSRRTRHIGKEQFDGQWPWDKENLTGEVKYRRIGAFDLSLTFDWDDEYNQEICTLHLKGPASGDTGVYFGGGFYFGGTSYFNQGFSSANRVSDYNYSPSGKGPGFYLTVSANTNVLFNVDSVDID
jgi:hypothetical protein